MKIGSDIVSFFVFYEHDDDTSSNVRNLNNYNKDGSPEAALFTWGTLRGKLASGRQWVELTEFTWLLITYVRMISELHTS
jgi:hypothetical protein